MTTIKHSLDKNGNVHCGTEEPVSRITLIPSLSNCIGCTTISRLNYEMRLESTRRINERREAMKLDSWQQSSQDHLQRLDRIVREEINNILDEQD